MATCGDAGGINSRGEPCGTRTAPGNRCAAHREDEGDQGLELKPFYQKFVLRYCVHGNGARAYREAGGDSDVPAGSAYQLLQRDDIQAAIQERMEKEAVGATELTARLGQQAKASLWPFLTEDGRIDLTTAEAKDALHLIRKLHIDETEKDGNIIDRKIKIELHDPQGAMDKVAKILGLYREEVDVVHRHLLVEDVDSLPEPELDDE